MSLKTWLAEYMPVPASEAAHSKRAALEHSKRWWRGLRASNLRRHRVLLYDVYRDADNLNADRSSALCKRYAATYDEPCVGCPLFASRGNVRCDVKRPSHENRAPHHEWTRNHDPEPMIAALGKPGYGMAGIGAKSRGNNVKINVHAFFYRWLVGPVPPGLVLDHLRRTTECVNPLHLEPVTNRENVIERAAGPLAESARTLRCSKCGSAKHPRQSLPPLCRRCKGRRDSERWYRRHPRKAQEESK